MSEAAITLPEALSAWNTEAFVATLKREVEALGERPPHLDRCQNTVSPMMGSR